jgi:DNA polymerase sigma
LLEPTAEEMAEREMIFKNIRTRLLDDNEKYFKFTEYKVHGFGSSCTGLAIKDDFDIDITVYFGDKPCA